MWRIRPLVFISTDERIAAMGREVGKCDQKAGAGAHDEHVRRRSSHSSKSSALPKRAG